MADGGGVGVMEVSPDGRIYTRSKKDPRRMVLLKKSALHGPPIRIGSREPFDCEQGWMPSEPREWRTPDRLLRAAILERAVLDAQWDDQDAIRWIHGLVPSAPTFSCEDICDTLEIPVERLRAIVPWPRPRRSEDAREALGRSLACRRHDGD